MNKSVDYILYIDTFEQQCVVIKCMLQSSRLEDYMKTIVVGQLICTRSSFEHKCLKNIKKIYQNSVKCDDQQNLKYIIDAARLSSTEGVTDDSCNTPITSTPVIKPSARKSL